MTTSRTTPEADTTPGTSLGENSFLHSATDWVNFSCALRLRCNSIHHKFVDYYLGKTKNIKPGLKTRMDSYFASVVSENTKFQANGTISAPENYKKLLRVVRPYTMFNIYQTLKKVMQNEGGSMIQKLEAWEEVARVMDEYNLTRESVRTLYTLLWLDTVCQGTGLVAKYFEQHQDTKEIVYADVKKSLERLPQSYMGQKRPKVESDEPYKRRHINCYRCNQAGHIARYCDMPYQGSSLSNLRGGEVSSVQLAKDPRETSSSYASRRLELS